MASELKALILAAGFSSRMGRLKALMPLGRETMLDRVIRLFRDLGIDQLVVSGHEASKIKEAALAEGASVVHNPDFATGMFSSIRTGIRRLDDCRAFFLLPVDIPLIRRGTIDLLIQARAQSRALIHYPVFAGRRGHPPLIDASLIPAIAEGEESAVGLRGLLAGIEDRNPRQVIEVQTADANIHFDLDTPEDHAAALNRLRAWGYPDPEECAAIIGHLHPLPDKGLAHGRRVAEVAVALCEAINASGGGLDVELCRAGGLLHDLAKGQPRHEEEGARRLRQLGFDRVAELVAAHRDMDWPRQAALGERELVHLADKLVRGSRLVSLEQRFGDKLRLFEDDPEAMAAIRGRLDLARRVEEAVAAAAGRPLTELLAPLGELEGEWNG